MIKVETNLREGRALNSYLKTKKSYISMIDK